MKALAPPWWAEICELARGGAPHQILLDRANSAGIEFAGPFVDGLCALGSIIPADLADPVGAMLAVDSARRWGPGPREIACLLALGSASRYLGTKVGRDPELSRALSTTDLTEARTIDDFGVALRDTPSDNVTDSIASIRRFRFRELTRIFLREATGAGPVSETSAEVSALAAACLQRAVEVVTDTIPTYRRPKDKAGAPIPFCVIAVGKLGGRELNFSSDVDLVYLYGTDEGTCTHTASEGKWAVHRYFVELARDLTAAIDTPGDDGRIWRVDLRLRPEGSRGPLVHSLATLVGHYEAWGHTFERAVWLKARPVAGDLELGRACLAQLEPFVYRRYLDSSVVAELEEMKRKIDRQATARPALARLRLRAAAHAWRSEVVELLGWDVKVGQGGIREIEFVVQVFQLVVGGREPSIRTANTLEALDRLGAAGLLPAREATELAEAYALLRRTEHFLQMEGERQTHAMPSTSEELDVLGRRLGLSGLDDLITVFARLRDRVSAVFGRVFRPTESMQPGGSLAETLCDLDDLDLSDPAVLELLSQTGFLRPRQSAGQLIVLRSKAYTPLSRSADPALARLGPALIEAVVQGADPDLALVQLASFLLAVGPRRSVYSLFETNPRVLTLLTSLFGSSRYLGHLFARHPELVELVSAPDLSDVPSTAALYSELARDLGGVETSEGKMGALRRFKDRHEVRVALARLGGLIDTFVAARWLGQVAEAILEHVFVEACEGGNGADGLAVLALGKLGSSELIFGSDLDLVFVYRGPTLAYPGKLARRFLGYLSTQLGAGRLYAVDARLRPSGQQGPLLVSLAAFESYHMTSSAAEKVALTRARVVCGDHKLGVHVDTVIDRALASVAAGSDPASWSGDVVQVRRRIAEELGGTSERPRIKACTGGLMDAEFAAAVATLRWPNTMLASRGKTVTQVLAMAAQRQHLDREVVTRGVAAYRFVRTVEERLRMLEGKADDRVTLGDTPETRALARALGLRRPEVIEELTARLDGARQAIRVLFEDTIERARR